MYNNKKWYHLVGICGSSMNGIASYLAQTGNYVTGSDIKNCVIENIPSEYIKKHNKTNITKEIDFIVYTSAVTPGSAGYVELEEAKKLGITTLKRSEFIGKLLRDKISIGVTGMHGKSTTSAMIADILIEAGLKPSFLIGANVRRLNSNFGVGKTVSPKPDGKGNPIYAPKSCVKNSKVEYFVVEACEYDRSFLDMKPLVGVITNIDKEHLDYYKGGITEIKQAFEKFIKQIPKYGLLLVWQEDKYAMSLVKSAKCKVKRVSMRKPWPGLKLKLPGKQYLIDATLAAKTAHELGIDSKIIQKALNNFSGAGRRFEIKGKKDDVTVIDDYGHHPTEIKATIQSAIEFGKEHHFASGRPSQPILSRQSGTPTGASQNDNPSQIKAELKVARCKLHDARIIMVFQPHQQQRTKLLYNDFVKSFEGLSKLIVTDVFLIAGREKDTGENLAKKMTEDVKQKGIDAEYISGYEDIIKRLKDIAKPGDIIITQGATDIYKVGEEYLK